MATPAEPPRAAAANWLALFVSDIHLQAAAPGTALAFFDFLDRYAGKVKQVYLLGDLFEYWAGDDDLRSPFNARVVAELRKLTDAGIELFWMAGNRDFLLGDVFSQAIGARRLPDPTVLVIGGQRMVLAHGDAECIDDVDYQRFRTQVRDVGWQQAFLAQPLAQRLAIIAQMRAGSRAAQQDKAAEIMDVNEAAIVALFARTSTTRMIHGHTHRPALHRQVIGGIEHIRHVLPDWDGETMPIRGGGLAIDASGTINLLPVQHTGASEAT